MSFTIFIDLAIADPKHNAFCVFIHFEDHGIKYL